MRLTQIMEILSRDVKAKLGRNKELYARSAYGAHNAPNYNVHKQVSTPDNFIDFSKPITYPLETNGRERTVAVKFIPQCPGKSHYECGQFEILHDGKSLGVFSRTEAEQKYYEFSSHAKEQTHRFKKENKLFR